MSRVVMFVANDVTRDSRVLKEAATLAGAGHEVTVIGYLSEATKDRAIEKRDGFTIQRVAYRAKPPAWWPAPNTFWKAKQQFLRFVRIRRSNLMRMWTKIKRENKLIQAKRRKKWKQINKFYTKQDKRFARWRKIQRARITKKYNQTSRKLHSKRVKRQKLIIAKFKRYKYLSARRIKLWRAAYTKKRVAWKSRQARAARLAKQSKITPSVVGSTVHSSYFSSLKRNPLSQAIARISLEIKLLPTLFGLTQISRNSQRASWPKRWVKIKRSAKLTRSWIKRRPARIKRSWILLRARIKKQSLRQKRLLIGKAKAFKRKLVGLPRKLRRQWYLFRVQTPRKLRRSWILLRARIKKQSKRNLRLVKSHLRSQALRLRRAPAKLRYRSRRRVKLLLAKTRKAYVKTWLNLRVRYPRKIKRTWIIAKAKTWRPLKRYIKIATRRTRKAPGMALRLLIRKKRQTTRRAFLLRAKARRFAYRRVRTYKIFHRRAGKLITILPEVPFYFKQALAMSRQGVNPSKALMSDYAPSNSRLASRVKISSDTNKNIIKTIITPPAVLIWTVTSSYRAGRHMMRRGFRGARRLFKFSSFLTWGLIYRGANKLTSGGIDWIVGWRFRWFGWGDLATSVAPPADIWHAHDMTSLPAVLLAQAKYGGKVVYDSHEIYVESGRNANQPRWVRQYMMKMERDWIARCDAMLTVNRSVKEELKRRYHVDNIQVLYNCPPAPSRRRYSQKLRRTIGISLDTPVIMYHGILAPHRGLDEIMQAIMLPELAEVHAVFLGYGPEKDLLVEAAKNPMYKGRLHVLGGVPPEELPEWIYGVDVEVAPIQKSTLNHYFSSPNKVFESISVGTPVAGSDFPEFRRVIMENPDGPLGRLFDPSDPTALARAVKELLDLSAEEKKELKERCLRASRTRWNWEAESKNLTKLYEDLQPLKSAMVSPSVLTFPYK